VDEFDELIRENYMFEHPAGGNSGYFIEEKEEEFVVRKPTAIDGVILLILLIGGIALFLWSCLDFGWPIIRMFFAWIFILLFIAYGNSFSKGK
jgi:hypothetical protein